jgi:hypothetical protein
MAFTAPLCQVVKATHRQYQRSTTQARHKANVGRTDGKMEEASEMKERRAQDSPRFSFSQNPLLLLVVNNSNLTLSIFVERPRRSQSGFYVSWFVRRLHEPYNNRNDSYRTGGM